MANTDPRALRSRESILKAVRSILINEGVDRVTFQHVAEVAGVGRATVYRHWKTPDEMVFALLDDDPFRLLNPDIEGPLEERLTAWIKWVTDLIGDPERRLVLFHVLSRTSIDHRAKQLRARRLNELMTHMNAAIGTYGGWDSLPLSRRIHGLSLLIGPHIAYVVAELPVHERWIRETVDIFLKWLETQSIHMELEP